MWRILVKIGRATSIPLIKLEIKLELHNECKDFKMAFFGGKFYVFGLFLYFVIWRIFWNIFRIVKSENHAKLKPSLKLITESKTLSPSKNMTLQTGIFNKPQPFNINTQPKNLTQQKKQRGKGRRIKFRKKNFGSFDSWERDTETEMKKVLLWTGYGPLQEGMMLWGRVLSDIVDGRCPESR